jgi:hypothetical protein
MNIGMMDTSYEEIECVFDQFPKFHMKILVGDFSTKVGQKMFSNRFEFWKTWMKMWIEIGVGKLLEGI